MPPLSIGFSPCPNDTHIFYALMHGRIPAPGLEFEQAVLEDVETLNTWAMQGRLDITKLSYHALGHVLDEYVLLKSGSALGRGCGPLLVAARSLAPADLRDGVIAIPGRYTTAAMLLKLFAPESEQLVEMRFDDIMPSIAAGEVDAGVIIHESRFTYQGHGLKLVQDLGSWWEKATGCPIPLGGIAARRSLGGDVIRRIEAAIRDSVRWANSRPDACMAYIRQHARELEESVIAEHIGLYVNEYSLDLGREGMQAVRTFLAKGRAMGMLPAANMNISLD